MAEIGAIGRFAMRWLLVAVFLLASSSPVRGQTCEASEGAETVELGPAAEALERGNALAASGRDQQALEAFEASVRAAREAKDESIAALATASAARSAAMMDGATPNDQQRLEAAADDAGEIEDVALRARLRLHIGRSFMLISRDRRAAELFSAAVADARVSGAVRLESYALGYLGELYEGRGQYENALSVTNRALFLAETADSPDAIYRWQWQIGRIRKAMSEDAAALAAYRDSVKTIGRARELDHSGTEPVYEGLVGLLIDRAEEVEGADRQSVLREARNALEDQNASALRDYFHDPCLDARRKTTPDTIPGTLVLYPILLEDRTVLISSLGGVLDSHVVQVDRKTITEEIRRFRNGLEDRTSRSYLRQARSLYDWLIRPAEAMFDGGQVETLVFVPRGALYTIPMAALQDSVSKQYLIEKLPLAITPGLTLTEPRGIDRDSAQLLAVGVSQAVQGFTPLEFVPEEIAAVAELFPGRRLLNQKFVASAFENELKQQPFDIVHLASHGEFSANAEESFLLTYNDRISMDRLAQLVGKTRFRSRGLELLTLSACESAAGDDRAALGLAGVALQAGARSALATLWAVNDQVSAELMVDFYRNLAQPKWSRVAALQQAQVKVLKQRSYRHPAYWAPYLLIGSWL